MVKHKGYEVYEDGTIIGKRGNVVNGTVTSHGYRKVYPSVYVHRLVAECFLPNPEGKPQVNHLNGNKLDNRVENLEWATDSENNQHALDTGLRKPAAGKVGSTNNNSKLTEQQARDILALKGTGLTQVQVASRYGIVHSQVGFIWSGKQWGHIRAN